MVRDSLGTLHKGLGPQVYCNADFFGRREQDVIEEEMERGLQRTWKMEICGHQLNCIFLKGQRKGTEFTLISSSGEGARAQLNVPKGRNRELGASKQLWQGY